MSVHTRLVALLALCWVGPAAAQSASAERTWTDPPARSAVAAPAARPGPEAAEPPKPRADARVTPHARAPHAVAHRRPVAVVRTLTPSHPGLGRVPVHVVQVRVAPPARVRTSVVRPVRYGFIAPPPPPVGFYEDRRIRQAEAAGYLVVRRSTVAAPDGRLLYGYRPYDPDDADD